MFLSRYVISKKSVILEINPINGMILKKFKQPNDWEWDPQRNTANWEKYSNKIFLLYYYNGEMIFQEGKNRYILDETYTSKLKRRGFKWILFQLFKGSELVYKFKYQDPQTRTESLLRTLAFDDDWWDWDTPFDDVHNYLTKSGRYKYKDF